MAHSSSRRDFLGAISGAMFCTGAIGTVQAAETATLSGTITAESGARIQQDEITLLSQGEFYSTNTDHEGYFEVEVPRNATYKMGFYKADSRSDFEAVQNGAPHIYALGYASIDDSAKDLGAIELPVAHLVDLRVLKPSGEPLVGAQPGFRHGGWGENPSRVAVNTEGYTVIKGASFTGAEFAEEVTLEVEPPVGEKYSSRSHTYPISVNEPMTVTAVLDDSGVDWTAETTASFTDSTTTTTQSTTQTRTTTTQTATTPITTAASSTQSSTSTKQTSTTTPTPTRPTTTMSSRGFLSNDGPDADVSILTNPFYLTVGGFVLSVGGIAHQMLRGY